MTGRTSWWPCDAAEHDRELVVELGEEFGPAGPYVIRVLKDLAQQQHEDGRVRTGFRSLRMKTFVEDVETLRMIVEQAARIGQLDDLEIDADGRRFTCRISGWVADRARGRAAIKKADHRARDMSPSEVDMSTTEGDMSPPTVEVEEKTGEENSSLRSEPRARARKTVDHDAIPEDFPPELTPALEQIVPTLERVAAAKGAIAVARAGVARTIAARPYKPHSKAAADFEAWWLHGSGRARPLRDVVATFRNWLDREADMAVTANGAIAMQPAKKYANTGDFSRFDQVGSR